MTNPMLPATYRTLCQLVEGVFAQLAGIPDGDLNHWLPRDGMRDVNTFFALATHIAGAGEFWILEAAGGHPVNRHRTAEFGAAGSLAELRNRYDAWLAQTFEVLATLDDDTLASVFEREANPERGMSAANRTRAECIAHALEHTAVHLGHLQLQRQLWDAEQQTSGELA